MSTVDDALRTRTDRSHADLIALSHDLHAHPETAWEETYSAARVAGALADSGFTVAESWCGLDTAFTASIGNGDLHIALCAEYDALPGLGLSLIHISEPTRPY